MTEGEEKRREDSPTPCIDGPDDSRRARRIFLWIERG